jgi:phosphoribosylaminoimidazole carboxylase PurE protein
VNITPLQGVDALLSIVQMPRGVPVATVAVNNAQNAGLLAVQILAIKHPGLRVKLAAYRDVQKQKVLKQAAELEKLAAGGDS